MEVKVYPNAHHGFDADPSSLFRGKTKMVMGGHNDGRCYYEENTELPYELMEEGDVTTISQIGFKEWLASATEKEKKKVFKRLKGRHKSGWRIAQFQFDKSCVSKSTTIAYNKDAAEEATKLISEFFNSTLKQ